MEHNTFFMVNVSVDHHFAKSPGCSSMVSSDLATQQLLAQLTAPSLGTFLLAFGTPLSPGAFLSPFLLDLPLVEG
jgi:hypothetical protein